MNLSYLKKLFKENYMVKKFEKIQECLYQLQVYSQYLIESLYYAKRLKNLGVDQIIPYLCELNRILSILPRD